jgi:hypothetical protein
LTRSTYGAAKRLSLVSVTATMRASLRLSMACSIPSASASYGSLPISVSKITGTA